MPKINCRSCNKEIEYKTCKPFYCKECKQIIRKEIWLKNYHKSKKYKKYQEKVKIKQRKNKDKKVNCRICGKKISYKNGIPFYCKNCRGEVRNRRFKYRYHNDTIFRERVDATAKKYRQNNKKKLNKYWSNWRKTKTGKESWKKYKKTENYKIKVYKRRLKVREMFKNIKHTFSMKEWSNMRNNTKGICPQCKVTVGLDNIQLDHIYPVSVAYKDFLKTGIKRIYTINDIQPLCSLCNREKKDKVIKITNNGLEDIEVKTR